MPGTYSQLLLHFVFSTKGRTTWIRAEVAERLYPYIGGIVRAEKGVLYDIGGVEDHVESSSTRNICSTDSPAQLSKQPLANLRGASRLPCVDFVHGRSVAWK